jgi:hypothetical protein
MIILIMILAMPERHYPDISRPATRRINRGTAPASGITGSEA